MEVGGQLHIIHALPSGKEHPARIVDEPQSKSGLYGKEKNLSHTEI
jgi:hypothetical protein